MEYISGWGNSLSRNEGSTMFGVGGAVSCDYECLEGCFREIGSNVCSQVMEDLEYQAGAFRLLALGGNDVLSQRRENF